MLGFRSANGTSTVILTRVGLNCSTVLGTYDSGDVDSVMICAAMQPAPNMGLGNPTVARSASQTARSRWPSAALARDRSQAGTPRRIRLRECRFPLEYELQIFGDCHLLHLENSPPEIIEFGIGDCHSSCMPTSSPDDFVPGRDLSRTFYLEAVRPVLDQHFPDLPHSAALL